MSAIESICYQLALEMERPGLTKMQRAGIVAAAVLLIESQKAKGTA